MDELDQALCLTKDKKTNNYLLISERVEELIEEKKRGIILPAYRHGFWMNSS